MSCESCYYRKLCERAGVKPILRQGKCQRIAMYETDDTPFSYTSRHYRNKALERHLHVPYDASNKYDKDAQACHPKGYKAGFVR